MNTVLGLCDALLILGGEDRKQWPRSTAALKVYWAHLAQHLPPPKLIVSGGVRVVHAGTMARECTLMSSFLKHHGVRPGDVLEEPLAMDTLGNVVMGGQLARREGYQRLGLVTDDFHLWRSARLYQRVFGMPPALLVSTGDQGTWRKRFREVMAYTRTEMTLLATQIPRYNPEQHEYFYSEVFQYD